MYPKIVLPEPPRAPTTQRGTQVQRTHRHVAQRRHGVGQLGDVGNVCAGRLAEADAGGRWGWRFGGHSISANE